jgi:glucose-6-phosphate 1-dehydrogenase
MPTVVIFGASGDLTSRKLIPALYELARKNRLPPNTRIVGSARSKFTHEQFRQSLTETTAKFSGKEFDKKVWDAFVPNIYYHSGDIGQAADYQELKKLLEEIEGPPPHTRIYYLSTSPALYETAIAHLGSSGLADETSGYRRIVIEKPFGTDLPSARHLNDAVHKVFTEKQVYRIDHYLGKETVQNLLVLRFANAIFEPLWNRHYIDHVQITAAEEVLVGRRAGYYDTAGVLRDMFQNHLLQLLMITAMEAPLKFEADAVRNEKVKVLQAIRPMTVDRICSDTIRGQYKTYRAEEGVPANSQTPTFAVAKMYVDNWRWQGVPFYLRSGKGMSCRTTQIVIQFRQAPHMMFGQAYADLDDANRLVIQIQPAEGVQLHFLTKVPDAGMTLRMTDLEFRFDKTYNGVLPEAYERLLLDTLQGDPSLFARADEVEGAWGIIDPILAAWKEKNLPELAIYEPGLWGPECAIKWMNDQGRQWFDTCPVLA